MNSSAPSTRSSSSTILGSPYRHLCPVCGAFYSGEPYDSAWRWSVNDMLSDAALKLAVRCHVAGGEGEQARADRDLSSRILSTYAERYQHMESPPLDHPNHPGIVTWVGTRRVGLADSDVLGPLPCLKRCSPNGTATSLARQMFRPGAEHIQRVRWPEIHNATNWNNAALATLALVLEDEDLLEERAGGRPGPGAPAHPGGFPGRDLVGGLPELPLLHAGRRGLDPPDPAGLGPVFRRPRHPQADVPGADPHLLSGPEAPAVNDCWYFIGLRQRVGHGIPEADGFYETAYGWFHDPAFAWVTAAGITGAVPGPASRRSWTAPGRSRRERNRSGRVSTWRTWGLPCCAAETAGTEVI